MFSPMTRDHLLLLLGDRQVSAVVLAGHQSVQIGGGLLGNGGGHALDEVHELLILAHEVGLGVDLDHHAHAVDDGGIGHALGGDAAGLLGGGGHALLAQPLHGLVHIAVRGLQCLLAIHHAHAGHLAQVLHISCGKSHFEFLQTDLVYSRKCASDHSASAGAASSAAASSVCSPCLPSSTALAMMEEISLMARMASSLPGIT